MRWWVLFRISIGKEGFKVNNVQKESIHFINIKNYVKTTTPEIVIQTQSKVFTLTKK